MPLRRLILVLLCLAVSLCGACRTQRWPAPMPDLVSPLPAGDGVAYVPGPQEVLVMRHADPVQVRPAGQMGYHPLRFFGKKERLGSGAFVMTRTGGRAEVLWEGKSASVMFFDQSMAQVGELSRGEPALDFRQISKLRVFLSPELRLRLEGGAELSGDDQEPQSGPYFVERLEGEILRVRNQSKGVAKIAYRDERIELGPGQQVDLPLLGIGCDPIDEDPRLARLGSGSLQVSARGALEEQAGAPGEIVLSASGEAEVLRQGVRAQLVAGDQLRFGSLGAVPSPASAVAASVPGPQPAAAQPALPALPVPAEPIPGESPVPPPRP